MLLELLVADRPPHDRSRTDVRRCRGAARADAGSGLAGAAGRSCSAAGAAPLALVLTIGGAVGLFGLQAVLSDAIDDAGGGATRLDTAVAAFAVGHRTPVLTAVGEALNVGGGLAGLTVLAAAAATALLVRHRRLEAALVLAAPAAAGLLGKASKLGYDRTRPPVAGHLVAVTDSSLPSGHTLDATIVLGVLALVVLSVVHGRLARAGVVAVACAGIAVGGNRPGCTSAYTGLLDVVAGWLLGGAWVALSAQRSC